MHDGFLVIKLRLKRQAATWWPILRLEMTEILIKKDRTVLTPRRCRCELAEQQR